MSFCTHCGKEIIEGAKFCANCGTAAVQEEAPVVEQPVVEQPPVVHTVPAQSFAATISEEELIKEEQEFLDTTHRLLRWERKAWSICGKVFFILGIIFASIFGFVAFISLIETIDGDPYAAAGISFGLVYAIMFGGMFLAIGIIGRKVADKMPIYLDSLYTDFTVTLNRSGNVGMLVFSIFFGEVALVFFLINFIRIKAGSKVINRILTRQGKI